MLAQGCSPASPIHQALELNKMIYTILIEKDGAVIAAQETFESTDAAIRDIVDYGYAPHAILELQEDGTTQACTGSALECFIEQYLDEQKEA
jgi:hypothetical protein